MLRLVVLAAALVCALGAPRTPQRPRHAPGSRIIGGTEVTIEEVPFQLSFEEFGYHKCGAAIISADWAVTSAYCADESRPNDVKLRSGSGRRGEGGVLHATSEIIVHENYAYDTNDFDVAVIRVSNPFSMSATTAAIPLANNRPSAGANSFVSGWGITEYGDATLAVHLRWVKVPIYDQTKCDKAYAVYGGVTDRMICAGLEEGGQDSCQGDLGGPLHTRGHLIGIASWGAGCAFAGYPGVYSDVAYLKPWISEHTGVY